MILADQAPIQQTIANTPCFGSGDVAFWSKFAVRTLLYKISPNRYKVGSEIDPALPPPTVESGYGFLFRVLCNLKLLPF